MEEKNKLPKDMPTALDCAIRDKMHKQDGGYVVNNTTRYYNYICNAKWQKFLDDMEKIHQEQYGMGSGGELKAGKCPPKMASFGSSSRLIYDLSKDIPGFNFEERLDTRVGGTANLDGFIRRGNNYTYIEAKRREIYYPSHERQEIKSVYEPVYDKIKDECPHFGYDSVFCKTNNGEDIKRITFYVKGEPVKYFDLKQLICHFLGITYDISKHHVAKTNVTFLYLLYNPKEVEQDIDEKYREKVMRRYEEVVLFIKNNKELFEKIFYAVLQYQADTHNLDKPKIKFDFKLVDQDDYESELK